MHIKTPCNDMSSHYCSAQPQLHKWQTQGMKGLSIAQSTHLDGEGVLVVQVLALPPWTPSLGASCTGSACSPSS